MFLPSENALSAFWRKALGRFPLPGRCALNPASAQPLTLPSPQRGEGSRKIVAVGAVLNLSPWGEGRVRGKPRVRTGDMGDTLAGIRRLLLLFGETRMWCERAIVACLGAPRSCFSLRIGENESEPRPLFAHAGASSSFGMRIRL